MTRSKRSVSCLALAAVALLHSPSIAGEWEGLKIGLSTTADAKSLLGKPIREYPDSILFGGDAVRSPLNPDTVVVNVDGNQHVESLFIFPRWGLTDGDVRAVFGNGSRTTYGEFLQQSGITSYGAGTRAVQKLHYLPLELSCEAYSDRKVLVVYEDRDLGSGEQLVKLIVIH